jgi:hypothetical protein
MRERLRELSLSQPLVVGMSLICFVMIFRLLDIFIFRLDEILGEIILSKTIGFIVFSSRSPQIAIALLILKLELQVVLALQFFLSWAM